MPPRTCRRPWPSWIKSCSSCARAQTCPPGAPDAHPERLAGSPAQSRLDQHPAIWFRSRNRPGSMSWSDGRWSSTRSGGGIRTSSQAQRQPRSDVRGATGLIDHACRLDRPVHRRQGIAPQPRPCHPVPKRCSGCSGSSGTTPNQSARSTGPIAARSGISSRSCPRTHPSCWPRLTLPKLPAGAPDHHADGTRHRRLSHRLSTLVRWAQREEYLDRNPAIGLRVLEPEGDPRHARNPFSADQLRRIASGLPGELP